MQLDEFLMAERCDPPHPESSGHRSNRCGPDAATTSTRAVPVFGASRGARSAAARRAAAAATLTLLLATPQAPAAIVEEIQRVPVSVSDAFGKPVVQDVVVTVLRETERERSPILILSHGRGPERTTMGRARFPVAAQFFVEHGYLVVMPTRVGYGDTAGPDVETRGRDCAHADFEHGFAVAADETLQVLDWAVRRDDVDALRIVAVGQSYGGAATLALAARNPPGLVAAINFSGGSGGDNARRPSDPCGPAKVASVYEGYGRTTHVPELWLYSENDRLWGSTIPKDWFKRYRKSGAPARFVAMPPIGDDGHLLFSRGAALWQPEVLRFLDLHVVRSPAR